MLVTRTPAAVRRRDVETLRKYGLTDRDILDAVEVISYFNYINRVADALGIDPEPEMREAFKRWRKDKAGGGWREARRKSPDDRYLAKRWCVYVAKWRRVFLPKWSVSRRIKPPLLAAPAENLYSSFIRSIGTGRAHSYARKAVRSA